MIVPELLKDPQTGELVLQMKTLGAGLCWRLPMDCLKLHPDDLQAYIKDLIPKMQRELLAIKLDNQRRLRKKHGKKEKPRKKHKENATKNNPKAATRAASSADGTEGLRSLD